MDIYNTFDYKIIPHRKIWLTFSAAMLIPAIVFILIGGLKLGIDFTGGSLMELHFTKSVSVTTLKAELNTFDKDKFHDALVTVMKDPSGTEIMSIRSKSIDNNEQVKLFKDLKTKLGEFQQVRVEVVGPTMGSELKSKAIWSTLLVMGMIVIYLSIRFNFDYAACAIIALSHDVIILIGIFAGLGYINGLEIDSLFVTAVLTVAGFSVHDTIVVFDRIRENFAHMAKGKTFEDIANDSTNQTFERSVNTSVTVMIPLFFLVVLGGPSIRYFSLAMFLGILLGTYSSIFVATPFLVVWRNFAGRDQYGKRSKATA